MLRLLDTSVANPLRDVDAAVAIRIAALDPLPILSVLTIVELEGGIVSAKIGSPQRRGAVDAMLSLMTVLPFGSREAAIYGQIAAALGYSRRLIIDRMIAAQAIAIDATLVTLNPRDVRAIPNLSIEDWS